MGPDDHALDGDLPAASALSRLANLLILVATALLCTGYWWARPVIGFVEGLPAGKWLSVPVPYLPLLVLALGVWVRARCTSAR